jgi:hypothetical protein
MDSKGTKRSLWLLAILVVLAAGAYVVQRADTLSQIAQKPLPTKVPENSAPATFPASPEFSTSEPTKENPVSQNSPAHESLAPQPRPVRRPASVEVAQKPAREVSLDHTKVRSVASVMNLDPATPPAPPSLLPAAPALAEEPVAETAHAKAPAATNETKKFARHGKVIITPEYALATIFSKDRNTHDTATLASKYWLVVKAQYAQVWSSRFRTSLYLKLGLVDFEAPLASTKSLTNTKKFLSGLGVDAQYHWNEHNRVAAHLEVAKELFVRGKNTQQDTVDAINVTSFGVRSEHDLAHLQPFLIGATAAYVAKLPAASSAYDVKFGNEFGAGIYLDHLARDQKTSRFRTDLGAAYRMQSTSISTQSEMRLSLGLRLNFDIDEGGE